jgi:hypothetical protein
MDIDAFVCGSIYMLLIGTQDGAEFKGEPHNNGKHGLRGSIH